jgi:hypothetical protein
MLKLVNMKNNKNHYKIFSIQLCQRFIKLLEDNQVDSQVDSQEDSQEDKGQDSQVEVVEETKDQK